MLVSNGLVLLGVGLVFTTLYPEPWIAIIPVLGMALSIAGYAKAARWLRALGKGQPTRGVLTRVERDCSQQSNGVRPWRIEYEFDLLADDREPEREKGEGFCEAWDPAHERRQPGDHIWIVYRRHHGKFESSIWPPLR